MIETYIETPTQRWKMQEGHIMPTPMTYSKFKNVLDFCKPTKIFEIGFNGGHSARMWLELMKDNRDFRLNSIDICMHEYTEPVARFLEECDSRFSFTRMSSFDLTPDDLDGYDLIFVDGAHTFEGISKDLDLVLRANVPYVLVDDYKHRGDHASIGECVDALVQDPDSPYYFYGPVRHYEATSTKPNKMRLLIHESVIDTSKNKRLITKEKINE